MYSATFAITVIFIIAVTNLFFGFTAALLCGRGPQSWSDLAQAITFRRSADDRRASESVSTGTDGADGLSMAKPTTQDGVPGDALPSLSAGQSASTEDQQAAETAPQPSRGEQTTTDGNQTAGDQSADLADLFVPPPEPRREPEDDRPVDVILNEQLEQWKASDMGEEMPSATLLIAERPDADFIDDVWPMLLDAIEATISRQLRRDRHVLRLAQNEFAWFTDDVPAEDALLPAQRIRYLIEHTTFEYQGTPIQVQCTATVIAVSFDEDAAAVMDRLHATSAFASKQTSGRIAWDVGNGPQEVETVEINLEPTTHVLQA